jgi:hypothetical protein
MKKNPSEMGTIRAITLLLMISSMEMLQKQIRSLQNGKDLEEIADQWVDAPWAMLFREGTVAPWLGFGHRAFRDLIVMPSTAKAVGEPIYPYRAMNAAPVSALTKVGAATQDIFKGNFFSRAKGANSRPPRMIDFLMSGGDYKDKDGEKIQGSKIMQLMYDALLPTRAFYWATVDRSFFGNIKPAPMDRISVLAGAYSPIMAEMILNGDTKSAHALWARVIEVSQNSGEDIKLSPPDNTNYEKLFNKVEFSRGLSKERYKGPLPFSEQRILQGDYNAAADLLRTPQYIEVPLRLFD